MANGTGVGAPPATGGGSVKRVQVQLPDDVGHDGDTTKRIRKPTLARKHTLWQLYEDDDTRFSLGSYLRSFKGAENIEEGEDKEKVEVQYYPTKPDYLRFQVGFYLGCKIGHIARRVLAQYSKCFGYSNVLASAVDCGYGWCR